jgi:curved DNA-binding protein CbpA
LDNKGYYSLLGVPEDANYQEIKRAYRRLARKYHPDRNNSSYSDDMIKKINAAFEILSDREKRQQYDKMKYDIVQSQEDSNGNRYQVKRDPFTDESNYNHYKHADDAKEDKATGDNTNDDRHYFGSQSTETDFLDTPKGRFHIIVEPSLCMAFGSCETLAPKVFVVEKNRMLNPKAKVESETGADFETILAAAETCPTKAIKIVDRYTGEQVYP